jgi:hypothetical protein
MELRARKIDWSHHRLQMEQVNTNTHGSNTGSSLPMCIQLLWRRVFHAAKRFNQMAVGSGRVKDRGLCIWSGIYSLNTCPDVSSDTVSSSRLTVMSFDQSRDSLLEVFEENICISARRCVESSRFNDLLWNNNIDKTMLYITTLFTSISTNKHVVFTKVYSW